MSINFNSGIEITAGLMRGAIIQFKAGEPGFYYFQPSQVRPYSSPNDIYCQVNNINASIARCPVDYAVDLNSYGSNVVDTIAVLPLYKEGDNTKYMRVYAGKSYGSSSYGYRIYNDEALTIPYSSDYGSSGGAGRYINIAFVSCVDSNNVAILYGVLFQQSNTKNQFNDEYGYAFTFCYGLSYNTFVQRTGYSFLITEVSPEAGEASGEGGYTGGTFDDSSDKIAIPTAPTMGVTSAGFINVYSPSQGELVQFGAELFPNLSFTPVSQGGSPASVTDALVAMAQVLVDFGNQIPALIDMYINANLIQYVIDCHILPVKPTTAGTSPLKVGFKTFSQTPAKVTSDYVDLDCGTLNVGEYYANFIDYSPYTSAKLYLPFVGFMDIAPEYWQSGTIQVIYRFNVIDGSFVAYVKSTSSKSKLSDTVIAQFGGNACVHIPITGLNYASMVSGIVSAVSPLLPSAKANVGTVDKLVNSANTIASAKPTMQQSNGYNATTSFLTVRVPYLLIERSVSNFSRKYDEENGIPSNITLNFASLSGFTKSTMLHLDGIAGATEDDLDEIAQLLSEGVIL